MASNVHPQTDTSPFLYLNEILYTNETDLYGSPLPPQKKKRFGKATIFLR